MRLIFEDAYRAVVIESFSFIKSIYVRLDGEVVYSMNKVLCFIEESSVSVCETDLICIAYHTIKLAHQLAYGAKIYDCESRAYHSRVLFDLARDLQHLSGRKFSRAGFAFRTNCEQIFSDHFCDSVADH